jgi:transcriptional regulator with XRE-family HTH domain
MSVNANCICPDKVKTYRQQNGWSQELLAKASGLSLRTIQRIEKEGKGSAETQLALAATFNISPKQLFAVSSTLDANWNWRNIMQSAFALAIVLGAISFLFILAGEVNLFIDTATFVYLPLFMYAATVIAYGSNGLFSSILGLRYLFSTEISSTPSSKFLTVIIAQQIKFIYGGALIGVLIGCVAIHSSEQAIANHTIFHAAYAVNLLVLAYAAIVAEGLLRPLAAKLAASELMECVDL